MRIIWRVPDILNEIGDFFENPNVLAHFKEHNKVFLNKQDLLKFFHSGELADFVPNNKIKNLIFGITDEYDKNGSYKKMVNRLKTDKIITMAAPTIIKFSNYDLLFAGNKRCNLAMKYNIPIRAWTIDA